MPTLEWVDIGNPAGEVGEGNEVLCMTGANGASAVNIPVLQYPSSGSMVFSIWWRCNDASTTVHVVALGAEATGTMTSNWSRWYMVIPNPVGRQISIIPPAGASEIYMAMAQVEMGTSPTDWRESQEGFASHAELNIFEDRIESLVESISGDLSMFRQTATGIELFVKGGNSIASYADAGTSFAQTTMMITKDKMSVETGGTIEFNVGTLENPSTSMELNPNEFIVNTGTIELIAPNNSLIMDENGASMKNLTVTENFYAPNLNNDYKGPTHIYIGSYTDNGTTYQGNCDSLVAFSLMVNNKTVNNLITVHIHKNLSEYVEFVNISGGGRIKVEGNEWGLHGGINLFNCSVAIEFDMLSVIGTGDEDALSIYLCQFVKFENALLDGHGHRQVVEIARASNVYLNYLELQNTGTNNYLIVVDLLCKLVCEDVRGGGCDHYLLASGAFIIWNTYRPEGTSVYRTPCMTLPASLDTVTAFVYTPTQETYEELTTSTFTATDSGSYYSSGGWESGTYMRQGKGGSVQYSGYMQFDLSSIAGRTVKTAVLTLHRESDTGRSGLVNAKLWKTPLASKSGNPMTNAQEVGDIGTFAKDETKDYASDNLTLAVGELVGGSYHGLVLYINDTSTSHGGSFKYSDNYAKFSGYVSTTPPTLTITYV